MSSENERLFLERQTRYITAMECGKPDRVPIRLFVSEFMAKNAGYELQDIYYDQEKNIAATTKFLNDFDVDTCPGTGSLWGGALHGAVGAKYLKFAGNELEPNVQFQFVEEDYMLAEDYDAFIENPTQWILETFLPRLHSEFSEPGSYRAGLSLIKGVSGFGQMMGANAQAGAYWTGMGYPSYISGFVKAPFDTLGDTLRGLKGIMLDLRKRPDKVLAAVEMLIPHNMFYATVTAGGDKLYPTFLPLHRGSYPFLNEKQWDTFYWPSLKKVLEGLWANGKRTLFYAEGNWTPYLEKIAELPEKSIVFHVDQTDMAQAHKILGGRFCISGNVPNTMMSYGKPDDVREYVKRLIDTYAQDGGFIIDTAGVGQADVKTENVIALIETAREYGKY